MPRHPAAESFAAVAAEYERGRPDWPEAILDAVPVEPEAKVLDLGAGTGKLTRVLARRYAGVVAVEPLAELRAILAAVVPSADARPGRAEAIPLPEAAVDAVFAGQAFHWFAHDEAVGEIARVLRPAGVLAVLWNEPRPGTPWPLPAAYGARLDGLRDEASLPEIDWDVLARSGFGELHDAAVDHEQVSSRADVLAFAASVSWIAARPDRAAVLAELATLLPQPEYRFPLRANVRWARL
ncbi:MAG TPA: class I SAM-dependent methyltransferase [Gaiellaceae bacterium]|nr:class I SAM-dependent methyltransferase [Gaiellaceae bacterium]